MTYFKRLLLSSTPFVDIHDDWRVCAASHLILATKKTSVCLIKLNIFGLHKHGYLFFKDNDEDIRTLILLLPLGLDKVFFDTTREKEIMQWQAFLVFLVGYSSALNNGLGRTPQMGKLTDSSPFE